MDSSIYDRKHHPAPKFGVGPRSRDPPLKRWTKRMLRPTEQRLLEIAHGVGFGTVPNISVRNGELVLGAKVKTKRKHRLGKNDRGRCTQPLSDDFMLKQQHVELIEKIRRIKDGVVSIEIQDGLPVDLVVEEEVGI